MIDLDEETVCALIKSQAPDYGHLALEAVKSGGTDNTIFRLGNKLSVRLPKRLDAVSQIDKETTWLPRLAPLPLHIPTPVFLGAPGQGFDHPWAIYQWIDGAPLSQSTIEDWRVSSHALSSFLLNLQAKDISGAPRSGAQNHYRGVDLMARDGLTRAAILNLADLYSTDALYAIWDESLSADPHGAAPSWLHGDLQGGNILVANGQISAIIDFGLSGVGDPACDLMVAWSVLPPDIRSIFRESMSCDDHAWSRGKGWALSVSVIALDFYRDRNAALSTISRQTIEAVLGKDEYGLSLGDT
ncbi:MAG: aminoglycoside phosphotransferase family protein [Pseudomonadota bacterium]